MACVMKLIVPVPDPGPGRCRQQEKAEVPLSFQQLTIRFREVRDNASLLQRCPQATLPKLWWASWDSLCWSRSFGTKVDLSSLIASKIGQKEEMTFSNSQLCPSQHRTAIDQGVSIVQLFNITAHDISNHQSHTTLKNSIKTKSHWSLRIISALFPPANSLYINVIFIFLMLDTTICSLNGCHYLILSGNYYTMR